MTTEQIAWQPVAHALPDAETNVLLAFADGRGTCEGFLDGHDDAGRPIWRDVCADTMAGTVTHWAAMPMGPGVTMLRSNVQVSGG